MDFINSKQLEFSNMISILAQQTVICTCLESFLYHFPALCLYPICITSAAMLGSRGTAIIVTFRSANFL